MLASAVAAVQQTVVRQMRVGLPGKRSQQPTSPKNGVYRWSLSNFQNMLESISGGTEAYFNTTGRVML